MLRGEAEGLPPKESTPQRLGLEAWVFPLLCEWRVAVSAMRLRLSACLLEELRPTARTSYWHCVRSAYPQIRIRVVLLSLVLLAI
jgi:hypothetical protein